MCGVVGYIGDKNANHILIEGLKKLEYRGYDSAGVCVFNQNELNVIKEKGRVENLEKKVIEKNLKSDIGIGHTRWATHGEPNNLNSHPHISQNGEIAVDTLVDWVNVVWFTELYVFDDEEADSIISVFEVLETMDEEGVVVSDDEFTQMIEALTSNLEYTPK